MATHQKATDTTLQTLVDTAITDWRVGCGEECPAAERHPYRLTVEFDTATGQLYVQIVAADGDDTAPSLDAIVEIAKGVPCLHIAPAVHEDNALHAFATREGLVVVADHAPPEPAQPSQFTYGENGAWLWRRVQDGCAENWR